MSGFWTAHLVKEHLIQAFRSFPTHVVFSAPRSIRAYEDSRHGAHPSAADAFSWAPRFLATYPRARLHLFAWARCKAQKVSWRQLCRDSGWPLSTADASSALAASVIAEGLNAEAEKARDPMPSLIVAGLAMPPVETS